jgi:hypothetical protein
MKKVSLIILMIGMLTACSSKVTVTNKQTLPPGQAKKVTGTKSAAPFAPGQQKKTH